MDGVAGGAPRGNRNALKHGAHSAEGLALKRQSAALGHMVRETMAGIVQDDMAMKQTLDEYLRFGKMNSTTPP
jgi:hypothetical protein